MAAFKTYYDTAELAGVTSPHLVYDLRAKLDAAGHFDDFEVELVEGMNATLKRVKSEAEAAARTSA